jgi:hypothetical protein
MNSKKWIVAFGMAIISYQTFSQCDDNSNATAIPTSVGIVISTNDPETMWNALRFANFSISKGDTVDIFLLGKGVELENLILTNGDIKEQSESFLNSNGIILGCGTCLQSRNNENPQVCKFSSMSDLYDLVRKHKIVLTF